MKDKFEMPKVEVVVFETNDIIVTSGNDTDRLPIQTGLNELK